MGWFEGMLWKWTLAWTRGLSQPELHQLEDLMNVLYQQCPQQGQEDAVLWRGKNDYSVKDFQRHMSMEIEIDSVVSTV